MAGRGSGDHLGGGGQPVDPGGGGNSKLAAAANRLRQQMFDRLRPHPSPPSANPVAPPSRPLLSNVPSVAPLASNTRLNQLGGKGPPGGTRPPGGTGWNRVELARGIKADVLHRRPFSALRKLEQMPNFAQAHQRFLFNCVRKEVKGGCQGFEEPFNKATFGLEDLDGFDPNSYYQQQCSAFPLLTTAVAAAVSNGTFKSGCVQLPTNTARHGPRGGLVDQRHLCSTTLSRLLHNRHPNQIFAHATLNSLHNAVYMVPGREQMKSNRLGDSYSKKESLSILEGMCKGSDAPVKQLKERVEGLYSGSMASATTRYRKSVANRSNIFGIGHFVDNIGLAVVSRFNKGFENANKYLQMTMALAIENRIPTAHISDQPLRTAAEVEVHLDENGQQMISAWVETVVGDILVTHCPDFQSCKKFVKVPKIAFPDKMRGKSNCYTVDVSDNDPSTTNGCTNVLLDMLEYVPVICPCGEVRKKTAVFGDQGLCERCRKAVYSRTGEDANQRLNCLVAVPQDFHAMKENMLIWRETFDLQHQLSEAGSVSNIKTLGNHSQADSKVQNFYANDSLLRVVTKANVIALLQEQHGMDFINASGSSFTEAQFKSLVREFVKSVNILPWIWSKDEGTGTEDDEFLTFRKDKIFYGLMYMARYMACQYGDGLANAEFWKSDIYLYNLKGKFKYRIEVFELLAVLQGVYGRGVALDAFFNRFVNEVGSRNSNKPGDLKVEHENNAFKKRTSHLKGNYTPRSLNLIAGSMDLPPKLDDKLSVRYISDEVEKDRRKRKRKEKFILQVKRAVTKMQEDRTLKYEPGRKYAMRDPRKGKASGYLREERVEGVPVSFKKLKNFIKERKRDLALFVNATTEKCKCDSLGLPVAMEVDAGEGGLVGEDLVVSVHDIGPAEALANSDEEEYFTDDVEDEGDSD